MIYRFEKFGTLIKYKGIPIYIGSRCVTQRHFVWWWPINWVVIPIGAVIVLTKAWAAKGEGKCQD